MISIKTHSIGEESEYTLHNQLKTMFAGDSGLTEYRIDRFTVDVKRQDHIIEIQTRSIEKLYPKIDSLKKQGFSVSVVVPLGIRKRIITFSDDGSELRQRWSSKKGTIHDFFQHCSKLDGLMGLDSGLLVILLVEEEEHRVDDGKGSWRRKGIRISGRSLSRINHAFALKRIEDFPWILGIPPNHTWTVKELSISLGVSYRTCGKMAYALARSGIIERCGKQGKAYCYRWNRLESENPVLESNFPEPFSILSVLFPGEQIRLDNHSS